MQNNLSHRFRRCFGLSILLCLLTACQTLPTSSVGEESEWLKSPSMFKEREQHYQVLNRWRYSAKVGLNTPRTRQVANIIWDYSDQANNVRLFGPLGVGAVRMQFDQYGVELTDNRGRLHQGSNAEELISRIAGWPIPMDALSRWLFVLPTKDAVYRYQLDDDNNIAVMEQLGWSIEYSDYKIYNDRLLPRKIVATKPLANDGAVVVRLITKNWQ